ncbi:MAG: exodeoxyribonuclease VII small subunit [Candidatus Brocadiales bacterium]|nr:exodeoxyribonuclease VII small subunit [Candidatus Brocadiales bacterium]
MNEAPNYTEAFQELQEIVVEIEQGEISVDELSEKVKRAALLIKICRTKLTSTEEDVNKILHELDTAEANGNG